ncbi:uncharacterized protein BJ171DRAFT_585090 [Polychytrium aggregatum]|uniref:uncharacterized protein n=1 Tax=Polychytrium aggregatum TaxID=110093 RepID=UPI0022FEE38F|nr:uncharacterized protein BJ171DRAFT_585090 [Polychytrium aggregatum]KAI9199540.1 hypothetical protein BJ171DRAFT_585090 [Polychytrium aggregatum]
MLRKQSTRRIPPVSIRISPNQSPNFGAGVPSQGERFAIQNELVANVASSSENSPRSGMTHSTSTSSGMATLATLATPTTGSKSRARPRSYSFGRTPAQYNNPISRSSTTETLRQFRSMRAQYRRHDRTTIHVDNFIRIYVEIKPTPPVEPKYFMVVVEKSKTIERLCHQIEAEYAYRYMIPEEQGVHDNPVDDEDEDGNVDEASSTKANVPLNQNRIDPLECGAVYDSGKVALRFTDKVGEILRMDQTIYVVNAYQDPALINKKVSQHLSSNEKIINEELSSQPSKIELTTSSTSSVDASIVAVKSNADSSSQQPRDSVMHHETEFATGSPDDLTSRRQPVSPRSRSVKPIDMGTPFTLDDRFQRLIRNRLGLEAFCEFCVEDYTIENLLFWLDVEIYQTCPLDHFIIFGQYIYLMYIAPGAPLQVNLSEEIRRDINPPEVLEGDVIDSTIFDEAQEHIYAILKGHSFTRFERSQKCKDLQSRINEAKSVYESKMIFDYYAMFLPRISEKTHFVATCAARSPTKHISVPSDPLGSTPRRLMLMDAPQSAVRDQILNGLITQYFPQNRPWAIEGYFTDMNRLSTVQKQRKINKEKKITKFFGEKLSFDHIQRQLNASNVHIISPVVKWSASNQLRGALWGDEAESITSEEHKDYGHSEFFTKKKKVEKLEEFFGNKLPREELKIQKLATETDSDRDIIAAGTIFGRESSVQYTADIAPPTINELTPDEKRKLVERAKKLQAILGERSIECPVGEFPVVKNRWNSRELLTDGPGSRGKISSIPALNDIDIQRRPSVSALLDREYRMSTPTRGSAADRFYGNSGGAGQLRRSLSMGSIKSSFPVSFVSDESQTPEATAEREARRKKLAKLQQFLGERITDAAIVSATPPVSLGQKSPLTQKEKAISLRRANKLEKVFGQVVPSQMVAEAALLKVEENFDPTKTASTMPDPDIQSDLFHENAKPSASVEGQTDRAQFFADNIRNLTTILSNKRDILDLVDLMAGDEFSIMGSKDGAVSRMHKQARQKKVQKLSKFFGSTVNPETVIEQSVISALEIAINEEITDPAKLGQLKNQLTVLRTTLRQKSEEILRQGEEPSSPLSPLKKLSD